MITLAAIPFILLVFVLTYLPLFGWVYAFFDYKPGLPLASSHFVGLKYFLEPFTDINSGNELINAIINTFAISILGLLVSPLPAIFAIFLNEMGNKPFKKITQTMTTLPNFISWILVYAIFFATFSVEDGFVNQILLNTGLLKEPINPLANSDIAWFFQTGVGVWKSLGWNGIIFLAAITGIDAQLYDAAKVDGAGRLKSILHVTVPGILPTFFVLLLLQVAGFFNSGFEQFYVFDNAMVRDKLQVLDLYVYRSGIGSSHYSYATAIGMLKSVISVVLLFLVNGFSKIVRGVSIV